MIRIFKLVLLLVVSQVAFGQAPSNYTNINGRYRWIAGMFDSTFHIPKGTTPSLRTGGSTNSGGLFYNTSDSSVYTYTGTQWIKVRGSLNPSDTTNKYITQVYKKSGSDSVFYVKGGIHTWAFNDSTGNAGGGGGGKIYYFNGGVNMGTFGGLQMYELGDTANTGAAANFTRNTTGGLANFITDPGKPGLLQIPAGVWTVDAWLSESGGGSNSAQIWIEVEKWDGSTITTIATSPIEEITEGSTPNLYTWSVSIPTTTLAVTDRIVVQFYITNTNGKTVTLYTQNGYVGEIHTTFTTGIGALNGLTAPAQYLVTGTAGTDFNINSVTATHTFNLPTASATNRGALSSADWTTFNNKLNISDTASMLSPYLRKVDTASLSNRINLKLNISDTATMLNNYVNNVGYGLSKVGKVVSADSATLASYFLRRKDSLTSTNLLGYVTRKILADSTAAVRAASGTGTVTSVGSNTGTGLTGGPITTSGTLAIDTITISTRRWRQKGIDSVQSNLTSGLALKVNISDTASMLSPYLRANVAAATYVPQTRTITINGTSQDLSANRTFSVGTVTSVGITAGTGISVANSPVTGSGNITVTNTAPDQTVALTAGTGITIGGTYPSFTITNSSPSSGGTVTSVATNNGTGITGGTITGAGTLAIDTVVISTRAWRQKGIDSVQGNLTAGLALKLNISDTANMLLPYLRKVDTASLSNRINLKVNISDTASMLNPYLRKIDTASLSNRINLKVNISDTANMLNPYLRKIDTASLSNRINTKLNISDTATMLGNYVNNVGYGLAKSGQVVRADSATLASYFLRRKDSLTATNLLGYVTGKILADTAAAVRAAAGAGTIGGSGTANRVSKFTASGTIGNSSIVDSSSSVAMSISSAGNIGVGITPSNWAANYKAFQFNNTSLATFTGLNEQANLALNWYADSGGDKYYYNGASSLYQQSNGNHFWYTAPTGTANNSITFSQRMAVYNDGKVAVGLTLSDSLFSVTQGVHLQRGVRLSGLPTGVGTKALRIDANGTLSIADTTTGGGIGGSGTINRLAKFTASGTIGNSSIADSSSSVAMTISSGGTISLTSSITATQGIFRNSSVGAIQAIRDLDVTSVGAAGQRIEIGALNGTTPTAGAAIDGVLENPATTGYLVFNTRTASSLTEKMRLDTRGNLGLGVVPSPWGTFPAFQLGIAGVMGAGTDLNLSTNGYFNSGWKYIQTGAFALYNQSGGIHSWYNSVSGSAGNAISLTQAMTLNASSNLGLGTTTIGSRLQVNGNAAIGYSASTAAPTNGLAVSGTFLVGTTDATNTDKARINNDGTNAYSTIRMTNANSTANMYVGVGGSAVANTALRNNAYVWNAAATALAFGTSDVEAMRITSGGASASVGIGTSTIGSKLQVNGNAAIGYSASTAAPTNGLLVAGNMGIGTAAPTIITNYNALTINGTSGSFTEYLENGGRAFRIGSDGATGGFISQTTADPIRIFTNSFERMRITSGGNVGIGISAPTSAFHTNGSVAAKYVSKTATYTLDATDYTVVFNVSSAVTANLPDATTCTGRIYVIKVNNTTNTDAVTIDPNGAQTIDGNATYTIQCQYGIMIQSDGANWRIIADFGAGLNCL